MNQITSFIIQTMYPLIEFVNSISLWFDKRINGLSRVSGWNSAHEWFMIGFTWRHNESTMSAMNWWIDEFSLTGLQEPGSAGYGSGGVVVVVVVIVVVVCSVGAAAATAATATAAGAASGGAAPVSPSLCRRAPPHRRDPPIRRWGNTAAIYEPTLAAPPSHRWDCMAIAARNFLAIIELEGRIRHAHLHSSLDEWKECATDETGSNE